MDQHRRRDERGGVVDPVLLRAGQRLDGADPLSRRCTMQSPIHSTCCSSAATKLVAGLGPPGPWTVNRFGKPATANPR